MFLIKDTMTGLHATCLLYFKQDNSKNEWKVQWHRYFLKKTRKIEVSINLPDIDNKGTANINA